MKIRHARAPVKTDGRVCLVNVTEQVRSAVSDSGVREGLVLISVPHTTCGIAVNEDETGLRQDIIRLAEGILSPMARAESFRHDCVDDNAQAHLTSILLGPSATLPITGSALVLGTWQSVFLVEMDGPRSRSLHIQILGD